MLFWCPCRRFNSWMVFLAVFFLFWQKIGFVKHAPFCQFPSTTHQASFVWPHAFRLFMCAYSVLCLCDCLSIVCETESSPLTEWRLFSLAEWWLSEKSGEKITDEEWEGERVGECQKVRADGQKAPVLSAPADRPPECHSWFTFPRGAMATGCTSLLLTPSFSLTHILNLALSTHWLSYAAP